MNPTTAVAGRPGNVAYLTWPKSRSLRLAREAGVPAAPDVAFPTTAVLGDVRNLRRGPGALRSGGACGYVGRRGGLRPRRPEARRRRSFLAATPIEAAHKPALGLVFSASQGLKAHVVYRLLAELAHMTTAI